VYQTNSNKLAKVTDAVNSANSKLGDFKDGANGAADDYSYDVNGNLSLDQNKAISGITYNHLNLPWVITITGKGTITYTYDAAGNKLKKVTSESPVASNGNKTITTTNYINGFVYESKTTVPANTPNDDYTDVLQFIPQEEGRIRFVKTTSTLAYDYFIKDHLGNVRMVLTEEQSTNIYPAATMEGAYDASTNSMVNYEKQFYKIDNTKIIPETSIASWPTETVANTKLYYNHNGNPPSNINYPAGCTPIQTDGSTKLYKLNATTNRTGLEFMIKVMAGDKIDIFGKSYFLNTATVNNANSTVLDLATIMANMLLSPSNAAASKGITSGQLTTINSGQVPSSFFRGSNGETTTIPKAYINYIFFDEQFKYAGGDASRVGSSGVVKDHWVTDAQLQNIMVPKNGYIFVYVSNESNLDVFFDNLQVIHKPGPILEETHYYPWGLTMSGISSKAAGSLENKRKFNKGSELQNKEFSDGSGLELYATQFRSLDPQLGRWWQIDPKASESESPYSSMSNNPIRFNDPLGDTIVDAQIKVDKNWSKAYNTFLNSKAGKRFVKLYSPGGKYGKTTVGFKIGGTGASGKTTAFSINRKDGSATKLDTDKKYDGIDKVAKGQSKDSYLKFDVNLRAGDDMSNSVEEVEGGETILHETQHVRIDQQTLITDKAMNNPFYQHRDWMKPITSDWYKERADFYLENKQIWKADYERQKAQGKVKDESDYIKSKVNDFFN
jgi:RHS repeat-associated protein